MEEVYVEKFIIERIKENEKLFTKEELKDIYNNENLVRKIYILGLMDSLKNS